MKKIVRAIIKIPATPFIVVFLAGALVMCFMIRFYEWAYEADDFSKRVTSEMISDTKKYFVKWFTTI